MDATDLARIAANPTFRELERKRGSFGWTLAILMFAIYMGFIFLVAFSHNLVAMPIGAGTLTLAFPLGLGVILTAIILTGVYVVRANGEFDRLTREIVGEATRSSVRPVGVRMAEGVR